MKNKIMLDEVSPYIRYVNDVYLERAHTSKERTIYDHELIYVLDGEGTYFINGISYSVRKGTLLYIMPNISNYYCLKDGQKLHLNCIHFDWQKIQQEFDFDAEDIYLNPEEEKRQWEFLKNRPNVELTEEIFSVCMQDLNEKRLTVYFQRLYKTYHNYDAYSKLELKMIFLDMLLAVIKMKSKRNREQNPYHQKVAEEAMEYINQHYAQKINGSELAEHYKLTPKYFGSIFKCATGMTIREYHTAIRLERAKKLLMETELSLDQIAEKVGFTDSYYFIKRFKSVEGVTPGVYRKMI